MGRGETGVTELQPLLAIDTATDSASVAVYTESGIQAEYTWLTGGQHSQTLLPHVDRLLTQCGLRPADLGAVAVALGPGSYNGLRVGIATAKGLTLALAPRIPLLGVPTLDTLAYPHRRTTGTVQPLLDARRGEFATARYRTRRGHWERLDDYRLATLDEVCAGVERRTLFCGEFAPAVADVLRERLGRRARDGLDLDAIEGAAGAGVFARRYPTRAEFAADVRAIAARGARQLFLYFGDTEVSHPGQLREMLRAVRLPPGVEVEYYGDADHILYRAADRARAVRRIARFARTSFAPETPRLAERTA